MRTMYAYLDQKGDRGFFSFGNERISFAMKGKIRYHGIPFWHNGILEVDSVTKNGREKQVIDIYSLLSDLGYDADLITASIEKVWISFGSIIPDNYFVMYRRGTDRYQISCPRGSVLLDGNGDAIASNLESSYEEEAKRYFETELRQLKERKTKMPIDVRWVDRMADCSTDQFIYFRDGEVYYSAMKVYPTDWFILSAEGCYISTQMTDGESEGSMWSFERCMRLSGVIQEKNTSERIREIIRVAHCARRVQFGIAFYVETDHVRAIPLGCIDEYAVFDMEGNITETNMEDRWMERALAGYEDVKNLRPI